MQSMNSRTWLVGITLGASVMYLTLCVLETIRCTVFTHVLQERRLELQVHSGAFVPLIVMPVGCSNVPGSELLYKLYREIYNISTVEESTESILDASPKGEDSIPYFPGPSY